MKGNYDLKTVVGLTEKTAQERLVAEGFNELPSAQTQGLLEIMWEVVREPMFMLLVVCSSIYFLLGDLREALMLLSFVLVVMGITIYQERKTERALEALRDLSSPRALVIRDKQQRRIAGREVVREDMIVLAEGDRVPADARLLAGVNLSVDESLLTGESVPVRKAPWDGKMQLSAPGGDDLPFLYSGTLVVQGQGLAEVLSIGINTQIGKIGRALQSVQEEQTLLQKETANIVKKLTAFGLSLCVVVVVLYALTRGDWLNGLLAGITLAMATLPEEFPVVLTVFLALGAWRMSQKKVLTRRVPAVETLGSATVLCVDKTGTLTLNKMTVKQVCVQGKFYDIDNREPHPMPEDLHEIVEFSILASQKDPFDPMEKAFKQLGEHYLSNTEHLHYDWTLVHQYPLSPELLALSHVWKSPNGSDFVIAAKGAPEAIADLCHLNGRQLEELNHKIQEMAAAGLRILGIAKAQFTQSELPDEQHDFVFEFLGLMGLADPVRETVPAAISECYNAGIRVIMITGDYAGTARSIAGQIGLSSIEQIITGSELELMGDSELQQRIKNVDIFARVVPEQKLRIVEALKANGEIVAMTGDGVNDAPALKSAHIGVAMGGRGTDVAREASGIVILDDDFSSIVQAVKMGRRIFDNLKKAMAYIFAIHVPIAGLSLFPVLFGWPLVLLPMHVVFLELIIDPACSVVFEAESAEENIMNRPPRNPNDPLLNRRVILLSVMQGVCVLLIILAVFAFALYRGMGENESRALAFTTLIIANIGLILTNRSWSGTIVSTLEKPNKALWFVLGGAAIFLGLALYLPVLQKMFRFAQLHAGDIIVCLLAGAISIVWFEVYKIMNRNKRSC